MFQAFALSGVEVERVEAPWQSVAISDVCCCLTGWRLSFADAGP